MKILAWFQRNKIPLVALAIGLLIGSGMGYMKLSKERSIFQDKMKDANKKIAYIQKKAAEEKNETTASLEQRYQGELEKLQKALSHEKKAKDEQVAKLTEQAQKLEKQAKDTEEALSKTRKELQETAKANKELDHNLKKTTTERQSLQADLKKTTRDLGQCIANNADLIIISEELVSKYKDKGLGAVILAKEPITQVKKVELEQLAQQYRDEIEQRKLKKKGIQEKNVNE
jgi:ABC-type transporter Mla subunit MlaD